MRSCSRTPRSRRPTSESPDPRYRVAFTDWLACAHRGAREPAAEIAREGCSSLEGRVLAAGAAGHVLDFDDTYLPGLAHLSAPVAPAALVLGAETGATIAEVLSAYAAGFETMGALARASHPELYERGWHPTSVCGVVGAAVAAGRILDLSEDAAAGAVSLALLRSGGLRSAFGSPGKALQVGGAAVTGVDAARLAQRGAQVPAEVRRSFEAAYGATWAEVDARRPAIDENWVKAHPCCLQTHSTIEACDGARRAGAGTQGVTVTVHPVSLQAAPRTDVTTGLEAKFSIPYVAAFTLLYGAPKLEDFAGVDRAARELATTIEVRTDPQLLESEARLEAASGFTMRIEAAWGSPQHPMTETELAAKITGLAGTRLDGAFEDGGGPASGVLEAALPETVLSPRGRSRDGDRA